MARSAEGRGTTVEEATHAAMAALGLEPDQVTVEVLHEGKRGLFGGSKKATVRVTARQDQETTIATEPAAEPKEEGMTDTTVPATTPEAEDETQAARPVESSEEESQLTPEERVRQLDEEADIAADFVEGMLDLLDLPGDIEIEVQETQAFVNVSDVGSGLLIGRRGATLDALQELVRAATQRKTERRAHVRVDVEGYRARQVEKLRDKCREAIAQVRETGEQVRLEPMDPYERKMMHELVAKTGGVASASEGYEPKRRVVVRPAEQ
ncbi:MAG: RNA-binding cell elongation regulator Jag/EloR [Egibacteraceae bacterium]